MSNESQNNTPHWRNKLDELEYLPGSAFTRDAAWDKLYGRLRGNRKSKKITWYWIAAACLLFGLMITLLNYHKDSSEPANKETVMKLQPREIKKPVLKVEEASKNENENSAELIKDKIVTTSYKPMQRNRRITLTGIVTKVHPDVGVISYPEKEPLVKPLQIINSNSSIVALPQKKKLNVVHINELGDPIVGNPDVVRNTDIHSFRLKLASGEVLTTPAVVSGANSFTFLKINPKSN
jgi:hypothetical protein